MAETNNKGNDNKEGSDREIMAEDAKQMRDRARSFFSRLLDIRTDTDRE